MWWLCFFFSMYTAEPLLKQISFNLLDGTACVTVPALMLRFISHETISKG